MCSSDLKIISLNTVNGLTFSTYTRHKGNSLILIYQSSLQSIPVRIETMIQIFKDKILYVVQYFLQSESVDVFAKYPTLKITTQSKNCGQLVVVDSGDIESHFACLDIDSDHIAVVSLSRVSLLNFQNIYFSLFSFIGILILKVFTLFNPCLPESINM